VNDSIFVLSNSGSSNQLLNGEKYLLKENKWKEVEAKNTILSAPFSLGAEGNGGTTNGPAALLYE
jgi:arginase family enzyme